MELGSQEDGREEEVGARVPRPNKANSDLKIAEYHEAQSTFNVFLSKNIWFESLPFRSSR